QYLNEIESKEIVQWKDIRPHALYSLTIAALTLKLPSSTQLRTIHQLSQHVFTLPDSYPDISKLSGMNAATCATTQGGIVSTAASQPKWDYFVVFPEQLSKTNHAAFWKVNSLLALFNVWIEE